MKKVTICGFGNVGKSLVHRLYKKFDISIFSLSSTPKERKIITIFKEKRYVSIINNILRNPQDLKDTDFLIITVPNFLRENLIKKIVKDLNKNVVICFIPGIGPSQFIANKYLKDFKVYCLERVPFIARTKANTVIITGDREKIKYSTLFKNDSFETYLEMIFEQKIEKVPYYNVTLTSSNAILHTTRIYSLFYENYKKAFKRRILFYKEWDNKASNEFRMCDEEIVKIYEKLIDLKILKEGLNISLMKYYESSTAEELTNKISGIGAFSNIELDMLEKDGEYFLKEDSRFLTEDIPFGLLMFKGLATLVDIHTPNIDKIILWSQQILKIEYLNKDGELVNYHNTGCPQNFDILNLEDLKKVFSY